MLEKAADIEHVDGGYGDDLDELSLLPLQGHPRKSHHRGVYWARRLLRWAFLLSLVLLLLTAARSLNAGPTTLAPLVFSTPKSIPHPDDPKKWLVYDAFFSSPYELVFMTPVYHDSRTDFAHATVIVDGHDVSGRYVEEQDADLPRYVFEPIRVIKYSLQHPASPHNTVQVDVEGVSRSFRDLYRSHDAPRDEIAMATLIGDDFDAQLAYYIAHHRRHGVTRFEIFYNGVITADVAARFPRLDGVHYHEWTFPKWHRFTGEDGLPTQFHHAQTPVHNMMIKRVLPEVEWLLLADVDELVYLEGGDDDETGGKDTRRLVDYLAQITPIPSSQRIPVHLVQSPNSTQFEQDMSAFAAAALEGRVDKGSSAGTVMDHPLIVQPNRIRSTHKTLYHRSFHGLANIHTANQDYEGKDDKFLRLAHLVELRHPDRLEEYRGGKLSWLTLSHL
jgi:hypothetical protein